MTLTDCTDTFQGPIPHMKHPALDILMPVKLQRKEFGVGLVLHRSQPMPERTPSGRLVYAMPGGGEFIA